MEMRLSEKALSIIKKMQQNELTEVLSMSRLRVLQRERRIKRHFFVLLQKSVRITKSGRNTQESK